MSVNMVWNSAKIITESVMTTSHSDTDLQNEQDKYAHAHRHMLYKDQRFLISIQKATKKNPRNWHLLLVFERNDMP